MSKKIKILIATGVFPPDIGGPATYSKLLADELPKYGLAVEVLSFSCVRHLPKIIRHFVYFLKLFKIGRRADVIFAQDPVSVGLPSALAAKILGKKFVLKIVGDYAWEQFQVKNEKLKFKSLEEFQEEKFDFITELRRKAQKFVAKQAKKIIVPSEYLKKIISQWGMDENKIQVIYNAVEQPASRAQFSSANKNYLLSIGRLVPWKGFQTLIEIMPDLPPEIKLIIIGSGSEKKNLEFRIKNLELERKVNLISQVPHQELVQYFAQAMIFVLNTGYEGLSHVVLEAMAQGVPIITTNIGGNPELIKNGENGILVEYNNKNQIKEAILKLWADQNLQQKFIQNSFKKLEKFSLDKMIDKTIEILMS